MTFSTEHNLTLFAGLRQDYYDVTGHTTNPQIGLIYKVCDDTTVKLLAGRAFRTPSATELYYEDGSTLKSNPNLKPETIKTYEVVIEKNLNKKHNISLSGFYFMVKDLIDQTGGTNGLIMFDNVSEVTAKGFEAAVDSKWKNGIKTKVGYSFVQTFDKNNRATLANSPKNLIKCNIIVPLAGERLVVAVENRYFSKRKTLIGGRENGKTVTDLTITYVDVLKGLDIQAGVWNLFDIDYGYPGFSEHQQDIIDQDGRTAGFKVTYRF